MTGPHTTAFARCTPFLKGFTFSVRVTLLLSAEPTVSTLARPRRQHFDSDRRAFIHWSPYDLVRVVNADP